MQTGMARLKSGLAVGMIGRVMYLYHYFTPLLISLVLFGLVVLEVRHLGGITVREGHKRLFLGGCLVAVVVAFQFYRPLTYYEFITDDEFDRRALLPLWELRCASCPRSGVLLEPCKGKLEDLPALAGGESRERYWRKP